MRLAAIVLLLGACATSKQEEKRSSDKTEAPPATTPQKPEAPPPPEEKSSAPTACEEARVLFDFNSYQLPADAKATVETFANCIKGKGVRVTIEGNADERGTEEYNLSLGENRARTVARYLELLGTDKHKVKTISFGKDSPLCTEHEESCWKQNRRVALKPSK